MSCRPMEYPSVRWSGKRVVGLETITRGCSGYAMTTCTSPSRNVEEVRQILHDPQSWNQFLLEYSDWIFNAAYSWCKKVCREIRCPIKRSWWKQWLDRIHSCDCDELYDAYLFLIETLKTKILPSFRGDCSLKTFLFPVLYPYAPQKGQYGYRVIFSEYLRRKHGRFRLPMAIQKRPDMEQKIFILLCKKYEPDWVANELNTDLALVQDIHHRYGRYIERWRVAEIAQSSMMQDDREETFNLETIAVDYDSPRENQRRNQLYDIFYSAFSQLRARERVILRLFFVDGSTAQEIAHSLNLTQRAVYAIKDKAVETLRNILEKDKADLQNEDMIQLIEEVMVCIS